MQTVLYEYVVYKIKYFKKAYVKAALTPVYLLFTARSRRWICFNIIDII
jgi:hypothetical protein